MKHSLDDETPHCKRQRHGSQQVFILPVQPGLPFQLPHEVPNQPHITELRVSRQGSYQYPFDLNIPVIEGDFNALQGLQADIVDVMDVLGILEVDSIRESVKQLTIEIRRIETVRFIQRLGKFPNLTKLVVKHTGTIPSPIPDLKAPNVREVEIIALKRDLPIGWESEFLNRGLMVPSLISQDQPLNLDMIARNCPHVEILSLTEIYAKQRADPIEKIFPNLKGLYIKQAAKLDWFRFSAKFFNCYMPQLEEFKLDLCDNCGTCYLTHTLCPNIRTVEIDIYGNQLVSTLEHLVLSKLGNLQSLKIGNVTELYIQEPMGPSIREILIFNTQKSPVKLIQGGQLSNLQFLKYLKKADVNIEQFNQINPYCERDIWNGEEKWVS